MSAQHPEVGRALSHPLLDLSPLILPANEVAEGLAENLRSTMTDQPYPPPAEVRNLIDEKQEILLLIMDLLNHAPVNVLPEAVSTSAPTNENTCGGSEPSEMTSTKDRDLVHAAGLCACCDWHRSRNSAR